MKPLSALAGPCEFTLYPEPFSLTLYTLPNSLCIYPDGRTTLADAVRGNLAINIDQLQQLNWDDGIYYNYYWPDHGLLLGDATSSVVLCDTTTAYLLHTAPPFAFAGLPIYGGGHSAIDASGQPIASSVLFWGPSECATIPLQLFINSPDINGDLRVNLTDNVWFARDLNGPYNYRSDFNYDGVIDSNDAAIMTQAVGLRCH